MSMLLSFTNSLKKSLYELCLKLKYLSTTSTAWSKEVSLKNVEFSVLSASVILLSKSIKMFGGLKLSKYCSLRTIVRYILGSGYKMDDILMYAKEYSEDVEKPIDVNNVPEIFAQIFDQFGF
jgi:hypothetical protein